MPLPIIGSVLSIGEKLIDKLIPDPQAKADAILKLKELEQSGDLAAMAQQVGINQIEASNPNLFVSGWRPFVGWVCGGALAVQLVVGPVTTWIASLNGVSLVIPKLDNELLTTLLIGMLGLGGMRTIERLNGKANSQ